MPGKERSIPEIAVFAVIVLISLFAAMYLTVFLEQIAGTSTRLLDTWLRALPLAFLLACFLSFLTMLPRRALDWVFSHRYLLGFALFIICVVSGVCGSSIGWWEHVLPNGCDEGLLWGTPRAIRSDDWAVTAPAIISQDVSGYKASNPILRASDTSVTLLPMLPAFSFMDVFKPPYWGFLLFDVTSGFAWMWSFRIILMLLATTDFFMILTRDNRWLSVAAAFVLTFSPYAEWWGCWEILCYGQMLVILLHRFLWCESRWKRRLCAVGIPWFCGCYLMIAYPAWLVPCFYVFAAFGLWVIAGYARAMHSSGHRAWAYLRIADILALMLSFAIFAFLVVMAFGEASQSIEGIANTVYPGHRVYVGGKGEFTMFDWIVAPFFSLTDQDVAVLNVCERSAYFSLFPLGLMAALWVGISRKKPMLLIMAAIELFYLYYIIFGVPEVVAKASLLGNAASANRLMLPIGFLDIAMLLTSISWALVPRCSAARNPCLDDSGGCVSVRERHGRWDAHAIRTIICLALAFGVSTILCVLCNLFWDEFWRKDFLCMLLVGMSSVFFSIFMLFTKDRSVAVKCLCISMSGIVLVSGICVNPVQRGVEVVTGNELYKAVNEVAMEHPGKRWVAEGSFIFGNFCAAAGAPTINSTNTYPNLDLWAQIDPNGDFEEVYMRYANINADISSEGGELFKLVSGDNFVLNLTSADLKNLNVGYLLADEVHHDDNVAVYKKLHEFEGGRIIYEINYK